MKDDSILTEFDEETQEWELVEEENLDDLIEDILDELEDNEGGEDNEDVE